VQVRDQGSIEVGADVDGAIIIIVLDDNDPVGKGELLFQVMSIGLLLLPGEGGGTLVCTGLIQGLARSSHINEESLLLSLCGRRGGVSHDHNVLLLSLNSGSSGLLLFGQEVGGDARHG
jgi:hypothetical protein